MFPLLFDERYTRSSTTVHKVCTISKEHQGDSRNYYYLARSTSIAILALIIGRAAVRAVLPTPAVKYQLVLATAPAARQRTSYSAQGHHRDC